MYGLGASQPLGSVLRGSYNTYLNQGCRLLLTNPTNTAESSTLSMKRFDGKEVLASKTLQVPAHGLTDYDLCKEDVKNVYGVVTLHAQTPNSLLATVLRTGEAESYAFPTPVRE